MFFSKITLLPDMQVIKKLNNFIFSHNDYLVHQLLWQLFRQDSIDTAMRSFIYRDETNHKWPSFYVISQTMPDNNDNFWKIETKLYAPHIETGQRFQFILRVNPRIAKKTEKEGKIKSIHYDIIQDTAQNAADKKITSELIQTAGKNWLEKRSQQYGFQLLDICVDNFQKRILFKGKQENPIRFSTIDYNGYLQVIDVEEFEKNLFQGIGPAKGFGCGLLLIKR